MTVLGPDGAQPRRLIATLVPLMLVLFLSTLDQTIVASALPSISKDLGTPSQASWIATAYLLTSAITTLILGKLGDLFGRKRILQVSIVVFLVGSIAAGLAPNMGFLVAMRALQGVGGGGLNALVMAVVGDVVPARQRPRYQAFTGVIAMIAMLAGPLLGGLFSDTISWRWIFYINVPVGIAALAMIAVLVRLPRPEGRDRSIDYAGAVLSAVFTASALLVATWGGSQYAWGSPRIVALVVIAAAALIAYLFVESRAREPLTPLSLFRSSIFSISSAQFALGTLALFVGMLYIPLMVQTTRGYSAFAAGCSIIPMLFGVIVGSMVSGNLITSTGRYKWQPVAASVITAASFGGLALVGLHASIWFAFVALFFAGIGSGVFVQVALVAGQNAVRHDDLGIATGALNFFKTLGGAFGAAIFAGILNNASEGAHTATELTDAFHTTFLWVIPFMAVSFALALLMREKPLSDEMKQVAAGEIEVLEY